MARTGVVLYHHNGSKTVIEAVRAVLKSMDADDHIYLVDDASTDDSVERIIEAFAEVEPMTLIQNEQYFGPAAGRNIGLYEAQTSGCEYYFCLDSSVCIAPDCLNRLVGVLQSDEELGIVAPQLGSGCGYLIDWKRFQMASVLLTDSQMAGDAVYVDAVSGNAMMISAELVEIIGGFPEEYEHAWYDMELCIRATMHGKQVAVYPPAKAVMAETVLPDQYVDWCNWLSFFFAHTPNGMLDDFANAIRKWLDSLSGEQQELAHSAYKKVFETQKNKSEGEGD